MPPKVTFETAPLVWFVIKGQQPDPRHDACDDGGWITALLDYLDRQNIIPSGVGKLVHAGHASFGVNPADAPRVLAWLKANSIEQLPQHIVTAKIEPPKPCRYCGKVGCTE